VHSWTAEEATTSRKDVRAERSGLTHGFRMVANLAEVEFARMQFLACYSSSQGFTNYRGGHTYPEHGLIVEFLYLCSLWRQGPPLGRRPRPKNAVPSEEENSS
jgi:hypothetical protein